MALEWKGSVSITRWMRYHLDFLWKVSASVVFLPAFSKGDDSNHCSLKCSFIGEKFSENRELSPSEMQRLPSLRSRRGLVMDAPTLQHSDV